MSKLSWSSATFMTYTLLLLHRSQNSQRRLLRLRESSHTGDREPFVGVVASERGEVPPALYIPWFDQAIFPRARHHPSIGTHLDRAHPSIVGLDSGEDSTLFGIPPAQHTIGTPTYQQIPLGAPSDCENCAIELLQPPNTRPEVCIPHK